MTESWFGRMYKVEGSQKEDFLIKTKGKVKVQIGNKFIDLINEDGEIVSQNENLFNEVKSVDEIKESGIYLCGESIYVRINDTIIKLNGEVVKPEKKE